MSTGKEYPVIRRILVAVDDTLASTAVLETAAQLAREFNASLIGIFVEDINLLRMAGLPFARELTWSTAMELHLDYQRMERVLRGHAALAQQAVVNITTRSKLNASLQIVRGQIAPELIRATKNVDLFILGKGRGEHFGTIARQVIHQAHCPVLLVKTDTRYDSSVMTIFTGSSRSEQMLNTAAQLARATRKTLLVLIPAPSMPGYQVLREQALQLLGHSSPLVTFQSVASVDACFDQGILREEGVAIVVLGDDASISDTETHLTKLKCSVLLAR